MTVTWNIIDQWRAARGWERAELARRAGIPERTIYSGLRKNARLQSATRRVMKDIFPAEFAQLEEAGR